MTEAILTLNIFWEKSKSQNDTYTLVLADIYIFIFRSTPQSEVLLLKILCRSYQLYIFLGAIFSKPDYTQISRVNLCGDVIT